METFLGYLVGLLVGVIMGLLGGGGSLLLPAMLYLLHLDLKLATAYTTILVGITALSGGLTRIGRGLIDVQTVFALGIPVSIGMLLVRAWLFDAIPEELFHVGQFVVTKEVFVITLFAALLFLSFATMMGLIGRNFKSRANLRTENPKTYYATFIVFGLLIGILPGFTGAGGGVLIVPLLVILFGLPMRTVVGTSLAIIAMKSFVGFCGGDMIQQSAAIEYGFLFRFSLLMILGVMIGSKLSNKIDPTKLKTIFAWFLLALGIFMLLKAYVFQNP